MSFRLPPAVVAAAALALAAAALALAAPASTLAATPESGAVSPEKPTFAWTGTVTEPTDLYDLVGFFNGGTAVRGVGTCMAPYCDTFTLTVAEGGDLLTLDLKAPDADNLAVEIVDPDGNAENYNDVDPANERTIDLDPTPGEWQVRMYGGGDYEYSAKATLALPADPAPEQP
jgi:hypothetical protein